MHQEVSVLLSTDRILAAYRSNYALSTVETILLRSAIEHAFQPQRMQRAAVPIRKSVTPDHIVCLECGKRFKVLKRHVRTFHHLTLDAYRKKWRLPSTYPAIAPSYAEHRRRLASEKMAISP